MNSVIVLFLNKIVIDFYPKTIKVDIDENFKTNQRVQEKYEVKRLTAFINAPIELHIVAVLWIIKYGVPLDARLGEHCLGNRLLLNKNKDRLIQGSSLFRPYYKQYQKWRDDSVSTAQAILAKNKNALFINLDIKDYFHSVRIKKSKLFDGRKSKASIHQADYNLEEIFLKIHLIYTELISSKYRLPYDYSDKIKRDKSNQLEEVILPIGLLSSYILANDYLKKFDNALEKKIKPAYYGRYVDDILIVISEPNAEITKDVYSNATQNDFSSYIGKLVNDNNINEKLTANYADLNKLEKYIYHNFVSIFKLLSTPEFLNTEGNADSRVIKLENYDYLYCQSDKTLAYFFDHTESNLILDKLKKELDERTSEFRDLPGDEENEETFEKSAYHLQYDNSEGKIRTLKDYKEDRFGLTVYLSNKIFSTLRQQTSLNGDEIDQVLKFFKGTNCLNFYRLWERIFTFFLVNKNAKAYVSFYLHCLEQIDKIEGAVIGVRRQTKVNQGLCSVSV